MELYSDFKTHCTAICFFHWCESSFETLTIGVKWDGGKNQTNEFSLLPFTDPVNVWIAL